MSGAGFHINANGIRQHVIRHGAGGPPLVLVPGITSPAPTWGFVAERLGEVFDTYVVDVRGRGLSATGPGLAYDLTTLADDLVEFLAALDLSGVTVVGHSMGGRIALRAAARDASRMARIVAVDPPVSGPGRRPYPSPLEWYVDSLRAAAHGMSGAEMAPFFPTWSAEHLALRAEWLATCDEGAVVTAYEGFHTDDIHADVPKITVPVALMVAGRGDVIRPEDVAELQSLLPALAVARVEDAGHMIPWDDYEGFFVALDTLLGTRLARAAS